MIYKFIFIQTLYFLFLNINSYRYIELSDFHSAIKSIDQYKAIFDAMSSNFRGKNNFELGLFKNTYRYIILDKTQFVGGVNTKIVYVKYHSFWKTTNIKSAIIYDFCIDKKYRKQGLAYKLLNFAVSNLKRYKIKLLALHLNAADKSMPISSYIYYKLGFKQFCWCRSSFEDFIGNLNIMINNRIDLYKLMVDPNACPLKGGYITSFCYINDYGKSNIQSLPKSHNKIKKLMKEMSKRAKIIDSTFEEISTIEDTTIY